MQIGFIGLGLLTAIARAISVIQRNVSSRIKLTTGRSLFDAAPFSRTVGDIRASERS
jgi:hypothetical protein